MRLLLKEFDMLTVGSSSGEKKTTAKLDYITYWEKNERFSSTDESSFTYRVSQKLSVAKTVSNVVYFRNNCTQFSQ